MLGHKPISNTVYISGNGFPVLFHGMAKNAVDCSLEQATYSNLTETFDTERRTLFYTTPELFRERFSPISTYDEVTKTFRRRVVLMILGSRFHTYGMLSNNKHNQDVLKEYVSRDKHPVRITNMVRDPEFPRYYTVDECQEAWLENLTITQYGAEEEYSVLSADLVSDRLDDEYVKQFFPRNDEGLFIIPSRFITSIQLETEDNHAEDGRVLIKVLHNACALV